MISRVRLISLGTLFIANYNLNPKRRKLQHIITSWSTRHQSQIVIYTSCLLHSNVYNVRRIAETDSKQCSHNIPHASSEIRGLANRLFPRLCYKPTTVYLVTSCQRVQLYTPSVGTLANFCRPGVLPSVSRTLHRQGICNPRNNTSTSSLR